MASRLKRCRGREVTYTASWEALELSNSGEGECANGDHGLGLHLDDWDRRVLRER